MCIRRVLAAMIGVYKVNENFMSKETSKESPIISFRVPLEAIAKLQESGRLGENFTKSELSNLIKNDWLASLGTEVPVVVDGASVAKDESVNAVYEKVEEVLQLLRSQTLGESQQAA